MSRDQKMHVVLIVKLIAVLGFMTGAIVCSVIHERDMAMVLMGGTMTGFSTLFVSSRQTPQHELQSSPESLEPRPRPCPHCSSPDPSPSPGPGPVIERRRHITKG